MLLLLFVIGVQGMSSCSDVFYKTKYEVFPETINLCKDEFFYVAYNPITLCSDYVAYYLTYDEMTKVQGGRRNFMLDPTLKQMGIQQPSVDDDVFGTEYNRGHLVTSEWMSYNKSAHGGWYDCYMMSNICPQASYLNQVEWRTMEQHVVKWILEHHNPLYGVTGVFYKNRAHPYKKTDIAIPDYFFVALCDPTNQNSVGMYGKNDNTKPAGVYNFYPVSKIEDMAGIQLFKCNNNIVNTSHWWQWNENIHIFDDLEHSHV